LTRVIDKLKFVGHLCGRLFQLRQFADDYFDILAHHRLAASQTNLFNPQLDKDLADVLDLFI
jgi:hypothetical protein